MAVGADDVALLDLRKQPGPRPPLQDAADVAELFRPVTVVKVHRTRGEPQSAVGAGHILQGPQSLGILYCRRWLRSR
jgi:hypothetical protein